MDELTMHTCVVDNTVITACAPSNQPKIYVLSEGKQKILLRDSIEEIFFPAQLEITPIESPKDIGASGVVILPLVGGGRGPIINYGETISLSLLQSLLNGTISTEQLSPELNTLLGTIPYPIANSKAQSGYAEHGETITLDHDWSGYPPKIYLSMSAGPIINVVHTHIGIDPDCITYVEVPQQEILYGHPGVVNDNQFTIKAAILEKTDPITVLLNWAPVDITGPPVTVLSTLSPITNTTLNCMGLRIKGTLGVSTQLAYEVSGAMYAQVSIDSGPWVDIAGLYWHFKANNPELISEKFDVLMVDDQEAHSYQFRGRLVVDSDDEPNRELTGSLHIDKVIESGSGLVLSNDLQIKWASKE